jgi:hypothetical protein
MEIGIWRPGSEGNRDPEKRAWLSDLLFGQVEGRRRGEQREGMTECSLLPGFFILRLIT